MNTPQRPWRQDPTGAPPEGTPGPGRCLIGNEARPKAEFDGRWITVRRRAGAETRIPLTSVLAVEMHVGLVATLNRDRHIRFVTAGGAPLRARTNRALHGTAVTVAEDPNRLRLRRSQIPQALAMRDAVLQAMDADA